MEGFKLNDNDTVLGGDFFGFSETVVENDQALMMDTDSRADGAYSLSIKENMEGMQTRDAVTSADSVEMNFIDSIPVRVVVTDADGNQPQGSGHSFPPLGSLHSETGTVKNGLSSSASSSSSSSSGSSSSSSSSDGSSSSSEDDNDDEAKDVNKVPVAEQAVSTSVFSTTPASSFATSTGSSSSEKGKLVAGGTVINDKIRVVPVKEKPELAANRGRGRPKKLQPENPVEVKSDPTFHFKGSNSKKPKMSTTQHPKPNNCNEKEDSKEDSKEDLDCEFALALQSEEIVNNKRSSLRNRDSMPARILDIDYLLKLQENMMTDEMTSQRESKRSSGGSSKKNASIKVQDVQEQVSQLTFDGELDGDTPKTYLRASGRTADWDLYLNTKDINYLKWIVDVSKFPNAPLSDIWEEIAKIGTKIEIPNPFVKCSKPVYWIATIRYFAGYKALVEFETFQYGRPLFAWITFCSHVPKPIGYCDDHNILLYPPNVVLEHNQDYLHLLRGVIYEYSAITLRNDHVDIVTRAITSKSWYKLEDVVEAMDCSLALRRRLGRVTAVVADRVHVTYINAHRNEDRANGFWFNVKSHAVRPLGWCQTIGLELAYVPKNTVFPRFDISLMPPYPENVVFQKGMMFEVIHPLHLSRIAAARIDTVYKFGYFLARIDCNSPLVASMFFVFHITSPWILPCGFCSRNRIELAVPRYENSNTFNWDKYCIKNNMKQLDLRPFLPRHSNQFSTGDKFEAIDLRQPTYAGPVTVIKTSEHLILVHFDGWSRSNSQALQWMECDSPDIYPAGWSEMVGQEFQSHPSPPRDEDNPVTLLPAAGISLPQSQSRS